MNLFDIFFAFDGQKKTAPRKPTGVFNPRIVVGFPITKSTVTAETSYVIAGVCVQKVRKMSSCSFTHAKWEINLLI